MKTVKQILTRKGADVWTTKPSDSVLQALQTMADKNVGALLVVEEGSVKGLISERDYARKVILKGRTSPQTLVKDIMIKRVACVSPTTTAEQCMALMTDKRVRHLPVMDDGQLVGIVSIGDLVMAIISDQQFMIEQLENYISG
jgi:CBS domain-containing protein